MSKIKEQLRVKFLPIIQSAEEHTKHFFWILFLQWIRAYLADTGSMLVCISCVIFKLVREIDLLLVLPSLTLSELFYKQKKLKSSGVFDGSGQTGFPSSHEHRSPAVERSRSIGASRENSSDYPERETRPTKRQQEKEWEHQRISATSPPLKKIIANGLGDRTDIHWSLVQAGMTKGIAGSLPWPNPINVGIAKRALHCVESKIMIRMRVWD